MTTSRERWLKVAEFSRADRLPNWEGDFRGATMERWYRDGLPRSVTPEDLYRRFELDLWYDVPVAKGPYPAFEAQVLETTGQYKIWTDELGALRKDFLVNAEPGFVTRSWLKFPVENRADFEKMRERFDPLSPGRFPADWPQVVRRIEDSGQLRVFRVSSFFWQMRDWMGFHNTCLAFYDQPELVREMVEFVTSFVVRLFRRIRADVGMDFIFYNEDMAYKHAPMIGPGLARDFLLRGYQELSRCFEEGGVALRVMDCDGRPDELMRVWLEGGLNGFWPMEIAAGCDPRQYARQYPGLVLMGGVDKRALAQDRAAIRRELEGLRPLVERGGFIPTVDHAIPADVPFDNLCYYLDEKRKLLEG
jgi:hypothetical protein